MFFVLSFLVFFLSSTTALNPQSYSPNLSNYSGVQKVCRKTKVAVLGAGIAGIAAARELRNHDIEDFVIVEYNSEIGGRCKHTGFGSDRNGDAFTVELGANWVQGTQRNGGPENPIWALAKKYSLVNHLSDPSSILTYNETGQNNFLDQLLDFKKAYNHVEKTIEETSSSKFREQNTLKSLGMQDTNLRAALSEAGYNPENDPQARTLEWYQMDYEYAQDPDVSSRDETIASYQSTFGHFSDKSHFSLDPRGFNTFIKGLASEFLAPSDPRLLLSTVVQSITHTPNSITIHNSDGSCIEASHAISTFSLGVLQNSPSLFSPPLPAWKRSAIDRFQMGTYTKIFMQFDAEKVFWNRSKEFFLYADPKERGYYPLFQSLDHESFLPGSGILFATIVTPQSKIIEAQPDEETKAQVLVVLRRMFGQDAVPEPIDFMYPRWGNEPWARGSFSNWPAGYTLDEHHDLRSSVGRIHFAGEAMSRKYYGYLHGAFLEGVSVGARVAKCVIDPSSKVRFND